jgi:hypothetical protein
LERRRRDGVALPFACAWKLHSGTLLDQSRFDEGLVVIIFKMLHHIIHADLGRNVLLG